MKRYFKIWLIMTGNSIQTILSSRLGILIFVFGKLFRIILYLLFVYFLFGNTKDIAGYDKNHALLFLLTYTFLGSVGQMLFREVYRFRPRVVSGDFDFDLTKPVNPLLRNMAGGFDLMDLITMPIILFLLVKVILTFNFGSVNLIIYILLSLNGLLITGAIHILVLGFGIITTEVDHPVMVYRDIETMGRFPVDIYKEPLRQILTFVIPVGIMFTIPVKALLGITSVPWVIASFAVGFLTITLSLKFWSFAIKKYSSASS